MEKSGWVRGFWGGCFFSLKGTYLPIGWIELVRRLIREGSFGTRGIDRYC